MGVSIDTPGCVYMLFRQGVTCGNKEQHRWNNIGTPVGVQHFPYDFVRFDKYFGLGCEKIWADSFDEVGSTIEQVQEKNWVAFWAF